MDLRSYNIADLAPPDLQAYLDHPGHVTLASTAFAAFEDALMYDFELEEGTSGLAGLKPSTTTG